MSLLQKANAIFLGSICLSIGINFFLVPFELLDGGIIGIGLIFNYILHVKAGLAIILLSIPIFMLAWIYNRAYFYNSLHGMLVSSFAIDALYPFHDLFVTMISLSPPVSSIVGGTFVGLGIGIMLRYETSTGGTDLLAQFIADKTSINVGVVIFMIDGCVVALGGLLLSKDTFLLSIVTIIFVGFATTVCTWKPRVSH
ncbi:hypothetical protein EJF36_01225 [Bacillus sp. HMF5848]|uniref:YitT family protein n=1 Tax=Bacillus sp. HMF5848 TaxID=2495421 RepID=UPI000F774519|nr:YitT family protein [Bacillus sp. HMF5848]RSK25642.1 hypothetical protein EJF36_01225 [Bacillus sp. HMF5848]